MTNFDPARPFHASSSKTLERHRGVPSLPLPEDACLEGNGGRNTLSPRRSIPFLRPRALGLLVTLLAPISQARWAPPASPEPPAAATLPVVYARPGEKLVVPVTIDPETIKRGNLPARLERGDKLFAPLVWIGVVESLPRRAGEVTPPPEAPEYALITRRAAEWTGKSGPWAAIPAAPGFNPGAVGIWAVVLDLPPDGGGGVGGGGVWLGGRKLDVRWLDALPFSSPLFDDRPPDRSRSVWFNRALQPLRKSPLTRWRARLAAGDRADPTRDAPDLFPDPIVEALAGQVEAQWSVGIENLARADRDLALRLKRRLALCVDFGDSVIMPAWSLDAAALQSLLTDLLSTGWTDAERIRAASGWLDLQPTSAAWVVDDAGTTNAVSGATVSTLALANLTLTEAAAYATPEALSVSIAPDSAPDMKVIQPGTVELTTLVSPSASPSPDSDRSHLPRTPPRSLPPSPELRTQRLLTHVGSAILTRTVMLDPAPVAPPGLSVGPLTADWSLGRWLAAAALTPDDHAGLASLPNPGPDPITPDRLTIGRLFKEPIGMGEGEGGGAASPETSALRLESTPNGSRWVLYIECLTPREPEQRPGSQRPPARPQGQPDRPVEREADAVTVFFGPYGSRRVVLRVTSDGRLVSSLNPTGDERVRVLPQPDRWAAFIPVPTQATDPANPDMLRLAIVRVDDRGVRSSWPRPMLPWQTEPGRLSADLSAWEGLSR